MSLFDDVDDSKFFNSARAAPFFLSRFCCAVAFKQKEAVALTLVLDMPIAAEDLFRSDKPAKVQSKQKNIFEELEDEGDDLFKLVGEFSLKTIFAVVHSSRLLKFCASTSSVLG